MTGRVRPSGSQNWLGPLGWTASWSRTANSVRQCLRRWGLPAVDDEVHELLKRFGFVTPMGHLDQALQSHGNGLWAAANGQILSFVMELIDEIAEKLPPEHGVDAARRRALELAGDRAAAVRARGAERMGRAGGRVPRSVASPPPSAGAASRPPGWEDSTFRLHIAFIVGRTLLRRFDGSTK